MKKKLKLGKKGEKIMKKFLNSLVCVFCVFNMLTVTNVFAQNEDDLSDSVIKSELTAEQIVSEDVKGYEIRKISRSELIYTVRHMKLVMILRS